MKIRLDKKICIVLVFALVFSCLNIGLVGYAQDDKQADVTLSNGKDDGIMQYNARPEVAEFGLINSERNIIAVDFTEEMATSGSRSITNIGNYLFSTDGGVIYQEFPNSNIQRIEAIDGSRRVVIQLVEKLSTEAPEILIKVLQVADASEKNTLNEYSVVHLKKYEIDTNSISNVVVVNPRVITFNTNFHISWINKYAITYKAGSEILIQSAEYKNTGSGADVTLNLNKAVPIDTDISNLEFLNFRREAFFGTMGNYNEETIKFENQQIKDGIAPVLIDSYTQDKDADGHIDSIIAVFNEDIRISSIDDSGISVFRYSVKGLEADGKTLLINLTESKNFDTGNKPVVQLSGKVCDLAGNIPVKDESGFIARDAANPVAISAEIVAEGKTKGFGNNIDDALAIRFSEPVYTNFGVSKNPSFLELGRMFGYIENGEMIDAFDKGGYIAKNMKDYSSNQLVIMLHDGLMSHSIVKGRLLRVVSTEYLFDQTGLGIADGQELLKIK